jgi:OOP family OmpA-OmpF porin
MQRDPTLITLAIIVVLAMISVPRPLWAQEKYTDFRGRAYTADDLGQALFPEAKPQEAESQMRTRGFTPQALPSPPPPEKASVALNVLFEFNSASILQQYYTDLDKLGQVLTQPQYRTYHVQIEGHTDNVGSDTYNQRLSEKRAESIKSYLVQRFAIPPERLVAKGYGKSRPRAKNDTQEGRDQNRRVEVANFGK